MDAPPRTLDLHFLGGSEGESIVIRFPDGKWAVIDAYTRDLEDPRENPTVSFLAERQVTELAFVCLSHPHQDHFSGLRQVLEDPRWKVHAVWKPAALPQPFFRNWLKAVLKWRVQEGSEREEREGFELLALARHVKEKMRLRWVQLQVEDATDPACKPCRILPEDATTAPSCGVLLFAPSSSHLETYQSEIERALERENPEPVYDAANTISAGLLLRYGKTSVMLSGDMTNAAWDEVEARAAGRCPPLQLLKVAHHGSTTGYTEERWLRYCSRDHTIAIVFPFHRHRLPTFGSRVFFEGAAVGVRYTVHPAPPRPPGRISFPDRASLLIRHRFKATAFPFRRGRWSLSFDAEANPPAEQRHGDAIAGPV